MRKIQTIFDRDWEGNRGVIDKFMVDPYLLEEAQATEKLDGTNVRITVRQHNVVRVEKRKNPTQEQKNKGIEEPWYIDAPESDPSNKWIYDGVKNTNFSKIPDGEWSGELIGKNIQGNPLCLDINKIIFFSLGQAPNIKDVPIYYDGLKEWLPKQFSQINPKCKIEGIVWHLPNGSMFKIKTKDFK